MRVTRFLSCVAAAALVTPALAAQTMDEQQVLERGRQVAATWWDADGPQLWDMLAPAFQAQLGDVEPLLQNRDRLVDEFGEEAEVLREAVEPLGENMQYWRVIELESGPEPFILQLVIQPDGLVAVGRGGWQSELGGPPED
jgi:hypothetical protein